MSTGTPKRYRDPTPALECPAPPRPALVEKLLCALIAVVLIAGAVWVSVHLL